ncbi:MAG: hypothetical protein KAS17_11460, partial [Victivallaceae bacterium]|nr:hypothetical protein [Victivallaceae bacterium]
MAVAFDTKEPTFRHKMYEEYKSTRAKMPDELVEQLPRIREAVKALNLYSLEMPGFEADDIIGTIACMADKQEINVLIASSDKDLCQLVNSRIAVLNVTMRDMCVIDLTGVKQKFGVEPDQIIDYLTLVGDTADNVPGVKGIGPKTAQALLSRFGTIENLYNNLSEMKPAIQKNLQEAADTIYELRKLIRIKCDVPISHSLNDMLLREPDVTKLTKIKNYLGFRSPQDKNKQKAEIQMELF